MINNRGKCTCNGSLHWRRGCRGRNPGACQSAAVLLIRVLYWGGCDATSTLLKAAGVLVEVLWSVNSNLRPPQSPLRESRWGSCRTCLFNSGAEWHASARFWWNGLPGRRLFRRFVVPVMRGRGRGPGSGKCRHAKVAKKSG